MPHQPGSNTAIERISQGSIDALQDIEPRSYGGTGCEVSATFVTRAANLVTMLHICSQSDRVDLVMGDFEVRQSETCENPELEPVSEVGALYLPTHPEEAKVYNLSVGQQQQLASLLESDALQEWDLGLDVEDIGWPEYHKAFISLKVALILGKTRSTAVQ